MREKKTTLREKLRGFTILELIVVIAIVSVLLGVLVPSMRSYFIRSRLNTANSNAKVLFNSLQTICMEYELADRSAESSVFYGGADTNGDGRTEATTTGWIFLCSQESVQNRADYGNITQIAVSTPYSGQLNLVNENTPSSLRNRVVRLFEESGEMYWAAYIRDYQVKTVWCAATGSTDYIGAYPVKKTEPSDHGMDEYGSGGLQSDMLVQDIVAWSGESWGTT